MDALSVSITLRSRQSQDGEETHLEQRRAGTLSATRNGWQLQYREPSGEGEETCLTLEQGRALLERGGPMETRMRFQPGAVHPARYQTLYGALELSVETDYLGWELSHSGGRVMIRYRLSAQEQLLGAYTLQLRVRTVQEPPADEQK